MREAGGRRQEAEASPTDNAEALRRIQAVSPAGHPRMASWHSFRLVARGLFRRPGFAAVSIATIALAIAANTAIFSIVHGTLLRPLPFRDPGQLVSFDVRSPSGFSVSLSIPNYRDWRDRNRTFERVV